MKSLPAFIAAIVTLASAASAVAGEAEDQYAVAAGHYSRQRWELAAEEFELFLEQFADHPQSADARFYLAEALVKLKRFYAARTHYESYVDQVDEGRHKAMALFRKGEMSRLLGEQARAQAELAAFSHEFSGHNLAPVALAFLGEFALQDARWPQAEIYFQQSLDAAPNGPRADECRFGLARAQEEQGRLEPARIMLEALSGKASSAVRGQAMYQLGRRQFLDKDYAAAKTTFTALTDEEPASAWRSAAALGLARTLLKSGETDAAHDQLASLLEDDEVGAEAALRLGLLHKERQEWRLAGQVLQAAALRNARHALAPYLNFHAGECLLHDAQSAAADACFAALLEDAPTHALADDALLGRMQAALLAGQHDAVDEHAKAFDASFASSTLRRAGQRTVARSLLQRERFAHAAELLGSCTRRGENDGEALEERHLLALALVGLKEYHQALEVLSPLLTCPQSELRSDAQLTRAVALVGLGQHVDAIAPLAAYLAAQPHGDRADRCRGELALCYARHGDFAAARRTHTDLLARHAESPVVGPVTLALAELMYRADRYGEASELYSVCRTSSLEDDRALALSGIAWCALKQDEFAKADEAFAAFLTAHSAHAQSPAAAVARAQILERLERWPQALAAWELVLERYPDESRTPTALLAAARIHNHLRQPDKAAPLFARLAAEFPTHEVHDAALYQAAWTHIDRQQADEAQKLFQRLHDEHPASRYWADATYRLADAAFRAADHARADALLAELIASAPTHEIVAHAWYLRGSIAVARQDWPAAQGAFSKTVEAASDESLRLLGRRWLIEARYQLGEYEGVVETLSVQLEQYSDDGEAWSLLALRFAQSQLQLKRRPAAQRLAERILDEQPEFSRRYEVDYLLGRCLADQALFAEARDAYRRVLRSSAGGKSETAAMSQWMIGETYFHQQNHAVALREYLKVEILYAYPRWTAAALLQAGKCYEHLGKSEQAVELYSRLAAEYADSPCQSDAVRRLEAIRRKQLE